MVVVRVTMPKFGSSYSCCPGWGSARRTAWCGFRTKQRERVGCCGEREHEREREREWYLGEVSVPADCADNGWHSLVAPRQGQRQDYGCATQ